MIRAKRKAVNHRLPACHWIIEITHTLSVINIKKTSLNSV